MAVLKDATASGKQLYQGVPGTAIAVAYTAPAASANVTAPSATAYIKEIVIAGVLAANVCITVGGNTSATAILWNVPIAAGDTKILSGLNTMIPAGSTIQVSASTAASLVVTISGVEIQ